MGYNPSHSPGSPVLIGAKTPGWDPDQVAEPPEPALNVEEGHYQLLAECSFCPQILFSTQQTSMLTKTMLEHLILEIETCMLTIQSPQDGRAGKKNLHREEEYEAEREYRRTEKEVRGSCEILQNAQERGNGETMRTEEIKWGGIWRKITGIQTEVG